MTIVPSLSRGTNSLPRRVASAPRRARARQRRAPAFTCPSAHSRTRPVTRLDPEHHARLMVYPAGRPGAAAHRREHGHERQRHDRRADEREDHRERHRPEHLPLDPLEREDREVHDHDDQLAEQRRLAHLDGRVADDLDDGAIALGLRESALRVLDDDHRAVDHEAEVDRAEGHERARRSRSGSSHRRRTASRAGSRPRR